MSSEEPILVERRDQRMHITLNRPEVLNAHNQPMREALVDALDELEGDDDLRVAILSGAGRAFSSGADIAEMQQRGDPEAFRTLTSIHFERVWRCDKPIIAAVHGHAAGGGFELAQLCDIRVAAADALFGQPEPRNVGGIGGIAVQHLHRLVPRGEAMLIHVTGRPITAQRAYDIGLVQRLAADRDGALAEADAIADQILDCVPSSLVHLKRIVRATVDLGLAEQEVLTRQLPPRDRGAGAGRRDAFLSRGGTHESASR